MNWFVWHNARLSFFDRIGKGIGLVSLICLSLIAFSQVTLRAGESAILTPAPAVDQPMAPGKTQIAVLSGGCQSAHAQRQVVLHDLANLRLAQEII